MIPAVSRYTLLALAIAATGVSATPADYICSASSGTPTACAISDQTYDNVIIESGTVLNGTSTGLHHLNSTTATLSNSGSVYGLDFGLDNRYSTINELNNNGTISGDQSGLFSARGTIITLNNNGTISSNLLGLINFDSIITALNNNGTISGDQFGLYNASGTITTLNNNGIISSNLSGLVNFDSTITTLNNSGTISGDDYGLYSFLGTITTLNNSGTISGGEAIYLDTVTAMTINNSGKILAGSASDYAIDAQNAGDDVTLNWSGGLIRGVMRGLSVINITGDVVYDTLSSYGAINLANGARMTLEQDRVQHSGSLTLADNARLDLYLSSATPLASSDTPANTAIVYGLTTATFANGSQIGLKVRGADFAAEQSTYTLLAGASIVDNGLSVVTRDSALLRVDSFSVNGSTVVATVSTVADYSFVGNTPNGRRAGNTILPLLSGMAGNNPVLEALAGDADEVARTIEQLVPQVNGAALQSAYGLNNMANSNANQRTQGLRGTSAGDTFVERGLWLKALGSDVSQDARDGIEGYDADLRGLAIGADGKLNDQLTLGLAYSYLNSDIKADGGNTTQVDGHAITLYSGYEQGAWFFDTSLTLGLNHNNSNRYIAGTEAKGNYDSQLFGLDMLGGYGFNLSNGLLIEPRVAARYARVDIESFREKGSIAALRVEGQRYEVAELGAGLRLAANLPLGQGSLQPQATLMAYHDFAADQIETQASFTFGGSPFLATGAKPARSRYEAGLGVDYVLANTTFGISYDYSGKQNFHADTLQAKVRYDF